VGLTHVDGVVSGPSGVSRSVRFMVDSGAKYSLFSRTIQPARLLLA
jgi:hypothetical protein